MGQTNEIEKPELILEKLKSLTIRDENNTSLDKSFQNIRNILKDYIFYKGILEKNNNKRKTITFFQRIKFSSSHEYSKAEILNMNGIYDKNVRKDINHKIERIKKWIKMVKSPYLDKNENSFSINIDSILSKENYINDIINNKEEINKDDINKINNKNLILSNYTDKKIENGIREFCKNQNPKFIERLKKGPPDCFRWASWCIINNLPLDRDNHIYENYTNMTLEKENKDRIIRDIDRTFSDKNIEKKELRKMETSLYKVLKAFWNLDKEVGYCQGMNLLVGFVLILSDFNERDTFYLLASTFSDTFKLRKKYEYNFRGLFSEEFPLLYFLNYTFELLLKQYAEDLKNHLDNLGITIDLWMGKWFQTVFTIALPISWCIRLWDNIFAENIFFMVKFGIAFAMLIKDDLMKMDEELDVLNYFKEFEKYSLCQENETINEKSDVFTIILKSKKIKIDIENILKNYEKNIDNGKDFFIKMEKTENIKYEFYEQLVSKATFQTILFSEEDNKISNHNNKKINLKNEKLFFENNNKGSINNIEKSSFNSLKNKRLLYETNSNKIDEQKKINNDKILSNENSEIKLPDINLINIEGNNNRITITQDSINESYYQNVNENIKSENKIKNIIKGNIESHQFVKYLNNNKLEDLTLKIINGNNDESSLSPTPRGKKEIIGINIPKEDDLSTFIGKNKFHNKKNF